MYSFSMLGEQESILTYKHFKYLIRLETIQQIRQDICQGGKNVAARGTGWLLISEGMNHLRRGLLMQIFKLRKFLALIRRMFSPGSSVA